MKSLLLCCVLGALAVAAEAAPHEGPRGEPGLYRGRDAGPRYGGPREAPPRYDSRRGLPGYDGQRGRLPPPPAGYPHRRDQDAAFDAVRSGRSRPLPQLERQVTPQIRGDYLGRPEYDPEENIYRMKFMRDGSMIWIDVDGRTGRILRRSGP